MRKLIAILIFAFSATASFAAIQITCASKGIVALNQLGGYMNHVTVNGQDYNQFVEFTVNDYQKQLNATDCVINHIDDNDVYLNNTGK